MILGVEWWRFLLIFGTYGTLAAVLAVIDLTGIWERKQ